MVIIKHTPMNKWRKSRFSTVIRIDPINLEFIRQIQKKNKFKTLAGALDLIINFHKGIYKESKKEKKPKKTNFDSLVDKYS